MFNLFHCILHIWACFHLSARICLFKCPVFKLQCMMSIMLCCIPSLDLDALMEVGGIYLLIKAVLTLLALINLKFYHDHLQRSLKVNTVFTIYLLLFRISAILHLNYHNGKIQSCSEKNSFGLQTRSIQKQISSATCNQISMFVIIFCITFKIVLCQSWQLYVVPILVVFFCGLVLVFFVRFQCL